MYVKCKRCGNFVKRGIKMCGSCGGNISLWEMWKDSLVYVEMGKSNGILHRYVERDGEIVELLPATNKRKRKKFVADRKSRKTRKIKKRR